MLRKKFIFSSSPFLSAARSLAINEDLLASDYIKRNFYLIKFLCKLIRAPSGLRLYLWKRKQKEKEADGSDYTTCFYRRQRAIRNANDGQDAEFF